MKNLTTKQGQLVEVVIDPKTMFATVNGSKLAMVKDNKVKVLNDMLLTDQSLKAVKDELSKFIKKEEVSKKRK